jgi:hypothetical protein
LASSHICVLFSRERHAIRPIHSLLATRSCATSRPMHPLIHPNTISTNGTSQTRRMIVGKAFNTSCCAIRISVTCSLRDLVYNVSAPQPQLLSQSWRHWRDGGSPTWSVLPFRVPWKSGTREVIQCTISALWGLELTLLDIVHPQPATAELMFLSACPTAELTEESITDGTLHRTAAMQYCSFPNCYRNNIGGGGWMNKIWWKNSTANAVEG